MAIHASKAFSREQRDIATSEPFWTYFHPAWAANFGDDRPILGAVIATCNLVDVRYMLQGKLFRYENGAIIAGGAIPLPGEPELSFGDYTPGRFAWILEDLKMLPEPIPAKGRLNLWEWE